MRFAPPDQGVYEQPSPRWWTDGCADGEPLPMMWQDRSNYQKFILDAGAGGPGRLRAK